MLDPELEDRIRAEAERRGVPPEIALAEARRHTTSTNNETATQTTKPTAERLLIGFLPFIKVRELRTEWLGLTERIPDDELTCGDYQLKHGGTPANTTQPDVAQ